MDNRSQPSSRRRRTVLLRLLAVGLGCLPVVLAECWLRFQDWPRNDPSIDAWVSFDDVSRLFERSPAGDRYNVRQERQPFFCPESFAVNKGTNEVRIFCLGGSTVQGRPYAIETSFTTWLELTLRAAAPQKDWDVVNCGGVSYASYRVAHVMQEILAYEPDLVILLTGHNEFLEDRSYDRVRNIPARCRAVMQWLLRSKLAQAAAQFGRQPTPHASRTLPAEVDAILDYEQGLTDYHRDSDWHRGVLQHFETSLDRMAQSAVRTRVPLLILNPTCNLRDTPPFKSQHGDGISPATQRHIAERIRQAVAISDTRPSDQLVWLQEAVELDPSYALSLYHLGRCYDAMSQFTEAKQWFQRACDEDICPLRIVSEQRQILDQVGRRWQIDVLDLAPLAEAHCRGGIPGDEWFLDHVHPAITGHQQIAQQIFDWMVEGNWVTDRVSDWEARRRQAYAAHRTTLTALYFARGQERLEGLRRWSQGRARKPRPTPTGRDPTTRAPE